MRDREFGVSARHFGLERRVEMYQWRATRRRLRAGLERGADRFDAASRRATTNPDAFPLREPALVGRSRSRSTASRWIRSVIEQLGAWRVFRPNFSRLAGQPRRDVPARRRWPGQRRESAGPADRRPAHPLARTDAAAAADRIVLRDGRWQLLPNAAPDALPAIAPEATASRAMVVRRRLLVVLIAAAVARRRRRR